MKKKFPPINKKPKWWWQSDASLGQAIIERPQFRGKFLGFQMSKNKQRLFAIYEIVEDTPPHA